MDSKDILLIGSTIVGVIFGFLGMYWAYRTRIESKEQLKRFDYLWPKVDQNILKDISEEELQQLEVEAQEREEQLKQLDEKIKIEVPKAAAGKVNW